MRRVSNLFGRSYKTSYVCTVLAVSRQAIWLAMRAQERLQGWRFHYLIFNDDDVDFVRS